MNGQQNMNTDKYKRFFSGQSSIEEYKEISDKVVTDKSFAEKLLFYKRLHNSFEDIHSENDAKLLNSAYKDDLSPREKQEFSHKMSDKNFAQKEVFYKQLRSSLDKQTNTKVDFKKKSNHHAGLYKVISAAAAVLLLVVSGEFFINTATNETRPSGLNAVCNFVYTVNNDAYKKYREKNESNDFESKIKEPKGDIAQNKKHIPKEIKSDIEILIEEYVQKVAIDENLTLVAYAGEKKIDLPDSYNEDLFLSNLANVNLRGASTEIGVIVTPNNLSLVKAPLKVSFSTIMENANLTIKDNNKKVVWSIDNITKNTIECDIDLAAGTYYLVLKQDNTKPQILQFFITK